MYEWFGALISSEASLEDYSGMAAEALNKAYCEYDVRGLECAAYESSRNPVPPRLSEHGFNRLLLAGYDTTWLLYLDLSDWDPERAIPLEKRIVRSKIVEGVLLDMDDETGSALRVVEHHGADTFTYQMLHPAVSTGGNHSPAPVVEGGLDLVEALVESRGHEDQKGACQKESKHVPTDIKTIPDVSIAFDCDTGTYMWTIAGWRVLASADGDIHEIVFANGTAPTGHDDDDSKTNLRYRVLSFTDGGSPRSNYKLFSAFADGSIFLGCGMSDPIGTNPSLRSSSSGARRLGLGFTLSGSNWCGKGQDPRTDNFCLGEYDGDWACRRHDACIKVSRVGIVPINGCSCDRDLDENRGSDSQARIIHTLFSPNGIYPCVAHVEECNDWGWVPAGRRRRLGYSYFGIIGSRGCENWNYINKFSGQLTEWGYHDVAQGQDLNSRAGWPGCEDNTGDVSVPNWLP